MDIGSQGSIHEVVEDNEEFSNDPVPENSGVISESEVRNNESRIGKNDGLFLFPEVIPKGAGVSDPNPPPLDSKPEMLPSTTRKGKGLKKWKRIDREARKLINAGKILVPQESPRSSEVSSSKRVQYDTRKQKSEGSVSSTNAMVQVFDDLNLGFGGSENSGDQSSKSSTAASALKFKQEVPGRIGSFSVENLRTARVGSTKKARGDRRVNIEKENSHSSLESDSRSSNFLFVQGNHSAEDSRMQDERLKHSDGGYEAGLPPEDVVADSSSEVKEERSENHGYSTPLDESISALQSAQEALQKEVVEFQEIGKDIPVDDSVSGTEFIIDEEQETGDLETEVEDLFKQKIEAEVEYTAISRAVQNLRVAVVDINSCLEKQKALTTEQTQMLDNFGVAENKVKKSTVKLEGVRGDIDEMMKLQNRACKYGSCFLVQLVLLLLILGFCMIHLSPSHVEVVPT